MPSIFINSSPTAPVGFLAPRVGPGSPGAMPVPALPEDQQNALTQKLFNTSYNENRGISWYRGLAETVAGTAIDLGDTLASSMYNATPVGMATNVLGIKPIVGRGDIWDLANRYGGQLGGELNDYYTRNQGRIEMMSGVTLAIGTGYGAGEMLLPLMADKLASSTVISSSRLWQAGARANAMTRSAMVAGQGEAAGAGEAYQMWKGAGALGFRGNAVARGVGKAAFEELAIAATTNTNDSIWSDDMSTNLVFSAMGLGVGGIFANYGAKYEMRRLANDPTQALKRTDAIDPQHITAISETTPDVQQIGAMYNAGIDAKESTNLTIKMLEARQITQPTASVEMANRFETVRDQATEQARVVGQKISTKGITGVPNTRFDIAGDSASAGGHVFEMLKSDPQAAFGLDSMGVQREARATDQHSPLYEMMDDREKMTEGLRLTLAPKNIREARRLEAQQPMVIYHGALLPAKNADAFAMSTYVAGRIKAQLRQTAKGANEFLFATETGKNVRINADFEPKIGKGNTYSSLPIVDQTQVNEALTNLMRVMKAKGEAHVVPANPSWYQLSAAVEFEKRGGSVQWQKAGITNADEAEVAALKDLYAKHGTQPMGSYWDRLKLNLPLPSSSERIYDATGDSIRSVMLAAEQGATHADLQNLRQQVMKTSGFDVREGKVPLLGDMFNFNRDAKGNWKQPVVAYYDSSKINQPLDNLTLAIAEGERKAQKILTLATGKQYGGLVQPLTRMMLKMPEFGMSQIIRQLADDQITGIGTTLKQLTGELLTREFRFRDNQTLLSALRVREAVNRATDEYIRTLTEPLSQIQKRLAAAPAGSSRVLVNQYLSNAAGWDIKQAMPAGKFFELELADTARNEQRLGRAVRKGETLVNERTGRAIALDQIGLDFAEAFDNVSIRLLKDTNKQRQARGLSEISAKKFYVPPPDTRNAFVGFTFDEEGQLVHAGAIVNKDKETFERLRREKVKNLPAGYTFKMREQIPQTSDEYDRAAMDWIHPGVGYAPTKTQTGTLASDLVNPDSIGDALQWVKRQAEQIGTNQMRVLYDSQLGIARARSAIEAKVAGRVEGKPIRTIWDEYQAVVLGQNLIDSKTSVTGAIMKPIEEKTNMLIANTWPAMRWMAPSHLAQWTADAASRMGVKIPASVKTFDNLTTHLGPYSPYQTAVDFAEQNYKVIRPPEIREITQQLGRISSALVLRYFELPMAAMNMIGIITTLPSILRSGKAPITAFYNTPTGRVGILDTMKIITGAMKDHLDPSKAADWARMVRDGNTTQQVADFNAQMASVKDRSSFNRVFLGDKTVPAKNVVNVRSMKDVKDIAKNKGVDGLISVLTDTTENWSRSWAHFAGLRLADMQGITGMDARHSFAQEIANAAIANYNPLNRPEFYQSAMGSMVGLFMSYMQSYNQRLFRWMETGDFASIGSQMAMQSSLFGVASMPGFNAVQAGLMSAGILKTDESQDATLIDHIYAKLGPEIGSAFAHGGLSQLGVALYTRGDMNYRDVTLSPTRLMAGIGIMTQAATAVKEGLQSAFFDHGMGIEGNGRLMEIAARNMPNRVMKGILNQIANGGMDIDQRGQIISENKDFFESAIRMLGVRSTRQQGMIEAFYANKQLQAREAARLDVLRDETRALIRNDPNWQSRIMEVFQKHLDGGGRPEHFRTWIKDQIRAATNPRDVNDLVSALRNPKNQMDVWRYGAYGGAD